MKTTELREPEKSLDHLRHTERWSHWRGTACPVKRDVRVGIPDLATVFCFDGVYQIKEGHFIFQPWNGPDGWKATTPEQIVAEGWRVD